MTVRKNQSQVASQGLKTVTIEVSFDPSKPDRLSRSKVGIWDIEGVTSDGYRIYCQLYEPAREKPARASSARVTVK